jgi:hypothetical protein
MKPQIAWLPLVLVGLLAGPAFSQGTAVQLPTYSYFGTGTTVSVPDRGSVYLGGVKRAATGMNEFGSPLLPFRNRSFGTERSASSAWMSVYIHDFEAMDEYLLSQPTPSRGAPLASSRPLELQGAGPAVARDGWTQRLDAATQGSAGPMAMSLAELRAEHQREQAARHEEALKWFERGRTAETSGKANVARVYYQMAARRASDDLQGQIAARLAALGAPTPSPTAAPTTGPTAAPKLARSAP